MNLIDVIPKFKPGDILASSGAAGDVYHVLVLHIRQKGESLCYGYALLEDLPEIRLITYPTYYVDKYWTRIAP